MTSYLLFDESEPEATTSCKSIVSDSPWHMHTMSTFTIPWKLSIRLIHWFLWAGVVWRTTNTFDLSLFPCFRHLIKFMVLSVCSSCFCLVFAQLVCLAQRLVLAVVRLHSWMVVCLIPINDVASPSAFVSTVRKFTRAQTSTKGQLPRSSP